MELKKFTVFSGTLKDDLFTIDGIKEGENLFKDDEVIFDKFSKENNLVELQISTRDPNFIPVIENIFARWKGAIDWVVKCNWNTEFECNKVLKPHGLYLNSLFSMIERIVTLDRKGHTTIDIFNNCCVELCFIELLECCKEEIKNKNSSWLRGFAAHEREKLNSLKGTSKEIGNINPYKERFGGTKLSKYIDKALGYKCGVMLESNVFYKKYWKPFLDAYSKYITNIEKNPEIVRAYIKPKIKSNPSCGHQMVFQTGKGKSPKNRKVFDIPDLKTLPHKD